MADGSIDKKKLLEWLHIQNAECYHNREEEMKTAYVHVIRTVRSGKFDIK